MSDEFTEISDKIHSWNLAVKNGWAIKISTVQNNNILIVVASQYTSQVFMLYCKSEEEACKKISEITKNNARELLVTKEK
jgi:hypothetical protein